MLIISKQEHNSGASAREARRDAPYLRKIGNSSSQENLVMTSAYERPSELANAVRTDSGGGGGASRGKAHGGPEECYIFSRRDFSEKKTNCICYVDKRSGTLI